VKTSELIAALAADPVPKPIRLGRRVALALAVGLAASVALPDQGQKISVPVSAGRIRSFNCSFGPRPGNAGNSEAERMDSKRPHGRRLCPATDGCGPRTPGSSLR